MALNQSVTAASPRGQSQDHWVQRLENNSHDAEGWFNLGCSLPKQGGAAQIRGHSYARKDCFKKAAESDPRCGAAWYNLGRNLRRGESVSVGKQKYNDTACFQEAVAVNPRDSAAWNNLGVSLEGKKEAPVKGYGWFTDKECFVNACEADEGNSSAWRNLANAVGPQGEAAVNGQRYDQQACREAAERQPTHSSYPLQQQVGHEQQCSPPPAYHRSSPRHSEPRAYRSTSQYETSHDGRYTVQQNPVHTHTYTTVPPVQSYSTVPMTAPMVVRPCSSVTYDPMRTHSYAAQPAQPLGSSVTHSYSTVPLATQPVAKQPMASSVSYIPTSSVTRIPMMQPTTRITTIPSQQMASSFSHIPTTSMPSRQVFHQPMASSTYPVPVSVGGGSFTQPQVVPVRMSSSQTFAPAPASATRMQTNSAPVRHVQTFSAPVQPVQHVQTTMSAPMQHAQPMTAPVQISAPTTQTMSYTAVPFARSAQTVSAPHHTTLPVSGSTTVPAKTQFPSQYATQQSYGGLPVSASGSLNARKRH